jgi:hypothetical protein
MRKQMFATALAIGACASACFVNDAMSTPYGESTLSADMLATEADAGPDVAAARCAPGAPFGREEIVYDHAGDTVFATRFSPDESEGYATVIGGDGRWRIGRIAPGAPPALDGVKLGTADDVGYPTISGDGRVMFFARYLPGADGERRADIYVSRRRADGVFDGASALPIATDAEETTPYVTPAGDALYFSRFESGRYLVHRVALPAVALTEVGALDPASAPPGGALNPVVTSDELTLYFASPNAKGDLDIWVATHAKKGERFVDARMISELRSAQNDTPSWISPDGCVLYFDRWTGTASKPMRAFRD